MNPRADGWGGDVARRARLIREVMRACRQRCGARFAIGLRLSLEDFGNARGMDLDDNLQVARWLVEDGADFVHASLWDSTRMTAKYPERHALEVLREAIPDRTIIGCGKIWTRADADAVIARGADMIALGRAGILNPSWPRDIASADGEVKQPPITSAELEARAVSPTFVTYLRRWKNLVAD
jgi:2,4-dienoyl-CoA reductase-like NADH-dependent reductase (Old Yellow Enzyme family)